MSVCTRLVLVLPVWLVGVSSLSTPAATAEPEQAASGTASAPAEEPPATPADQEAAMGPKSEQFNRLFSEWKGLLAEMRSLRDEYPSAASDRQAAIKTRFAQLIEQGNGMVPQLIRAAKGAVAEAPDASEAAGEFLSGAAQHVQRECCAENYEAVLPVAEALIEGDFADKSVYAWAGLAALVTNRFDAAERYFQIAHQNNAFGALGALPREHQLRAVQGMYRELITYYRKAWAVEQKIRAAEAKADDLPRVLLVTNKGEIEIELFENEAPNTVANFISLVEKGFYDGLTFHRVIPGFMAQGGCPEGTGSGGPGYQIPCECYEPNHRLHFRGTLSMAHAGRDTGGSQFFITFTPTKHLDGMHTAFGRVIRGIEVLAKLQRRNPMSPNPPPPDKILEAKVLRKRDHPYVPKKAGE